MNPRSDIATTADFTIEQGRANDLAPCECCGATTRIVRGFVYKAGTARAVYLVRWSVGEQHHDADEECDHDAVQRERQVAVGK